MGYTHEPSFAELQAQSYTPDEHKTQEVVEMRNYVIKFFGVSLLIIFSMMLGKSLIPKTMYFRSDHPYVLVFAIYICTILFGLIDNLIIVFDDNVLEDYFHHYFQDEMMSNLTVNILTACISLYVGAVIQDILGILLRKKIDPTAEQYAMGLLLGGGTVLGGYYIWKNNFRSISDQPDTTNKL